MISLIGNKRAFTLIELIVVMMVVTVLAGLSLPRFSRSLRAREFKDFITRFYLFLDYGRSYAVLKNTPYALEKHDNFIAMCDKGDNCTRLDLPEGIDLFLDDEERVEFFPDGSAQPFEVTVVSSGKERSVLFSRGFDGRIVIKDG